MTKFLRFFFNGRGGGGTGEAFNFLAAQLNMYSVRKKKKRAVPKNRRGTLALNVVLTFCQLSLSPNAAGFFLGGGGDYIDQLGLDSCGRNCKKISKNAFSPILGNGAWRSCLDTWEAEIRGEGAYSGPEGGGIIVT
jgi:hypothetical protein